jgi:hypothetical protein
MMNNTVRHLAPNDGLETHSNQIPGYNNPEAKIRLWHVTFDSKETGFWSYATLESEECYL